MAEKKTAFVLSENVAGSADGVTIPGVPGVWFHDRPMLSSAIGWTVQDFREAIKELGLPLVEVKVGERSAYETFPESPNRLQSAPVGPRGITPPIDEPPDPSMEPDGEILDAKLEASDQMEEERAAEQEVTG